MILGKFRIYKNLDICVVLRHFCYHKSKACRTVGFRQTDLFTVIRIVFGSWMLVNSSESKRLDRLHPACRSWTRANARFCFSTISSHLALWTSTMLIKFKSWISSLRDSRSIAITAVLIGLPVGSAYGQFETGAITRGIFVTASATEDIKPKSLRLVMQVTAKAKDAKKAIEELSAKKSELKKAFEEMKANTATIRFSDAKLTEFIAGSSTDANSSAEMQMMMQMQRQMGASSGGDAGAVDLGTLPTAFTSECQVKVDWDLPENIESDVITLLKSRLEGEVKKRDILKSGGSLEWSDDEKESLELFQAQSQGGYSSYSRSNQDFGSKIFVVGVVNEQITDKLSKQAFEKAVSRANKIAESTGVKKGEIIGVSFPESQIDLMEPYRYLSRNFLYEDQTPDTSFLTPGDGEVLGTKPSELKKSVSVIVVYDIAK